MNIIKVFMNNVIILLLAVRIYEDSDNRRLKLIVSTVSIRGNTVVEMNKTGVTGQF